MRYITLPLLLLTIFFTGCQKDDDCCATTSEKYVYYDSDNNDAPDLPAGDYEFAVRFPSLILSDVTDKKLTRLEVYMYDIPAEVNLRVYEDLRGSVNRTLHTQSVSGLRSNTWNAIELSAPVSTPNGGIWIGLEVKLDRDMRSVGCDRGPAHANGDWLYDDVDKRYRKYVDRVGTSVNWNMRALFR